MIWTNAYSCEDVGSLVKRARKDKGLTQEEFAESIGVSHATLSSLENGGNVSFHAAMRAISHLGMRLVIVPKNAPVHVEHACV